MRWWSASLPLTNFYLRCKKAVFITCSNPMIKLQVVTGRGQKIFAEMLAQNRYMPKQYLRAKAKLLSNKFVSMAKNLIALSCQAYSSHLIYSYNFHFFRQFAWGVFLNKDFKYFPTCWNIESQKKHLKSTLYILLPQGYFSVNVYYKG